MLSLSTSTFASMRLPVLSRARVETTRILVLAFALIFVLFVSASVRAIVHGRQIGTAAEDIANNATRSIQLLGGSRVELHRIATILARSMSDFGDEHEGDVTPLADSRRILDDHLAAYRNLPWYPGERAQYVKLVEALARFDALLDLFTDGVRHGDRGASRIAATLAIETADEISESIFRLMDLNGLQASAFAMRISVQRRAIMLEVLTLDGLAVALGIVVAAFSVRAVRDRERELRRFRADAEERADELELFAARVAHDVQSPLGALAMQLDMLQRREPDALTIQRATDRGTRALARVTGVVGSLLEFARSGARASASARASVDAAAETVCRELDGEAAAAEVVIENRVERGVLVACDPGLLAILLANLVRNAVKYMGESVQRTVVIRASTTNRTVRIEVEDTGPGVPEARRSMIFEPYVRGENERSSGLGLGLATVKRICEAHRGNVVVTAAPSGGSVFVVTLPAA